MRIIAGSAKGLRLQAPKGLTTRPTPDRVREALFSILQPGLENARVLDAFAGSGALGLEALSRGAVECVFVENNRDAQKTLRSNLHTVQKCLGSAPKTTLLSKDIGQAIRELGRRQEAFDLVFIDPPYALGLWEKVMEDLEKNALLAPQAWVVCEHPKSEPSPKAAKSLELIRQKSWGDIAISLYEKTCVGA